MATVKIKKAKRSSKKETFDPLTKFLITKKGKINLSDVEKRTKEIVKFVKGKSIEYWTGYLLFSVESKVAYTERSFTKTFNDVFFGNSWFEQEKVSKFYVIYDAYDGIISLIPGENVESPVDFDSIGDYVMDSEHREAYNKRLFEVLDKLRGY